MSSDDETVEWHGVEWFALTEGREQPSAAAAFEWVRCSVCGDFVDEFSICDGCGRCWECCECNVN